MEVEASSSRGEVLVFPRLPVKKSQCQNVPSQNVPESKCPKSKRPRVKTSQVKTSQSQNVPSQNVPKSKHPKSKRPKSNVPESKRPKSKRPKFMTNLIHMVCKLMEAYMIGWLVCVCLMTPGLSKDIQCHV